MTAWIKIIKNAEKLVENVDNVSRSKPLAAIREYCIKLICGLSEEGEKEG